MGIDPAALLAGPRGRRVCLEAATPLPAEIGAAPDPLLDAVFLAAYEREGGTVVVLSSHADSDEPSDRHPRLPPAPALDEVARMLSVRPPVVPDSDALLEALQQSVQAARYWQGPDGRDQLAAEPELLGALRPTADAVAGADGVQWWAAGVDTGDQWSVERDDRPHEDWPAGGGLPDRDGAPHEGGLPLGAGPATAVLAGWRTEFDQEEERGREEYRRGASPERRGGSWWSVPPHLLPTSTRGLPSRGAVGLHLQEDSMGWRYARLARMTVRPDARVYEIDGPASWARLCERFPLDASASRRGDWLRVTGRDGRWLIPDWPRVAEEFDGVHLSVLGYLSTAGQAIPVADDWATVLAGWDPDTTFWLTDGAVRETGERTDWQTGDDQVWRRR